MIDRLKADETIALINAVSMGTGSMSQDARGRYAFKLARQASGPPRKSTVEKSIAAAAGMGIKVIREESSQKRS